MDFCTLEKWGEASRDLSHGFTLKRLVIHDLRCGSVESTRPHLSMVIGNAKALEELSLSNVNGSQHPMFATGAATAVADLKNLKSLELCNIRLDQRFHAGCLFRVSVFNHVESFVLVGCALNEDGASKLVNRKFEHLKYLCLLENNLDWALISTLRRVHRGCMHFCLACHLDRFCAACMRLCFDWIFFVLALQRFWGFYHGLDCI